YQAFFCVGVIGVSPLGIVVGGSGPDDPSSVNRKVGATICQVHLTKCAVEPTDRGAAGGSWCRQRDGRAPAGADFPESWRRATRGVLSWVRDLCDGSWAAR